MDTDFARRQMVGQQVRAWAVHDPTVLRAIAAVPREHFVPTPYRDLAFADVEIPLANGQKMMTPTVEGRVLQALAIDADDQVLEIGTGSAYLTACLATLAATVRSVDIFDDFVSTGREKLSRVGLNNVELACLDACSEMPDGEFDAIAVTGSLPSFDDRFVAKLRPGGRLFIVVGDSAVQEARLIVRGIGPEWKRVSLFETKLAPLVNCASPPAFAF